MRDELAHGVLVFQGNGAPLHSLVTKKAATKGAFSFHTRVGIARSREVRTSIYALKHGC